VTDLRKWLPLVCFPFLLVSCAGPGVEPTSQPTQTLRHYRVSTSTPSGKATLPALPSPPPLGPTPTPFVHIVQNGETLSGIALRYGVSLDDLLIVNPGVNPRALTIGQELFIPGPEGEPLTVLIMTPTPLPLSFSPVHCYPTMSGGYWCLTTVLNTTSAPVGWLSGLVTLIDSNGQPLERGQAYSPLDIVPENGVMPLAFFFSDPPQDFTQAVAEPLSAIHVSELEALYRDLSVIQTLSERGAKGRSWRVRGEVMLTEADGTSEVMIRILLLAMDVNEEVIGFVKWEAGDSLKSGEIEYFDLFVYSLGPSIDHVKLLSEAKLIQ
jgi:LysM repeat protein